MPFYETITAAVSSIWANKMRAAFTMFGIVVGITSVMLITSVGDGFRNTINAQFEGMGLDEIQIWHTSAVREIERHERLTLADAQFLRYHEGLLAVTSQSNVTYQNAVDILGSNDRRAVQFIGVDEYNRFFSGPTLRYGRYISPQDVTTEANVVIIDEAFSRSVFGVENSIGRELEVRTNLGTQFFSIIGIFETEDQFEFMEMFEMPFEARVPITVVQRLTNGGDIIGSLSVRVYDTSTIHQTGDNLINLLEIRKNTSDIFNAFSMATALENVDAIITVFTVFLTMVASISLLVGGIGVMNIMLVSVTERTKEIGIRKSLGATNINIVFQFLIEAAFLTATGGAIGILLGYLGGIVVGQLAYILFNLTLIPTLDFVTIAVIVIISAGIGLMFGVYPANKASKLDPVDSLRFE